MGKQQTTTSAQTQQSAARSTGWGRGTIQHIYPERGFGFIRCTDGADGDVGQDFFFHTTGLEGGLQLGALLPGTLVEFECRAVPRGKRAEHVSLVR